MEGVPTAPDVAKLFNHFKLTEMFEGKMISYDEVGDVIGERHPDDRWWTVTGQWRKKMLEDHGIFIDTVRGSKCFKVTSNPEKVYVSMRYIEQAGRKAKKSQKVAGTVDRTKLSDVELNKHDLAVLRNGLIMSSCQRKSQVEMPAFKEDCG